MSAHQRDASRAAHLIQHAPPRNIIKLRLLGSYRFKALSDLPEVCGAVRPEMESIVFDGQLGAQTDGRGVKSSV